MILCFLGFLWKPNTAVHSYVHTKGEEVDVADVWIFFAQLQAWEEEQCYGQTLHANLSSTTESTHLYYVWRLLLRKVWPVLRNQIWKWTQHLHLEAQKSKLPWFYEGNLWSWWVVGYAFIKSRASFVRYRIKTNILTQISWSYGSLVLNVVET